jgi:hypothetical protein
MAFIAADAAGAMFSIVSLIFRSEFDLLATLNYIAVLVCDMIVVGFYVYFNKMHPTLARVREVAGGSDLEVGKESESAVVTIVESEGEEEKDEHRQNHRLHLGVHGTTVPNHLHAEPVTKTTTAVSQVSLSSSHSNSTVAQA